MPSILVVDDAEDIRDVARVALERLGGWDVLTASSGADALALAGLTTFDAILLDLSMPGLGGLETLRRLRSEGMRGSPPVILLTAGRVAPDAAELAGLGVSGVVRKPFDPLRLSHQVAEILAGS